MSTVAGVRSLAITGLVATLLIGWEPARALRAEEKETPAAKAETPRPEVPSMRVFQVKYADVVKLADILHVFPGSLRPDPEMKVITVNAPRESMIAIEAAIKQLDVPPQAAVNVELTVYLVRASREGGAAEDIPAALQGVVKQLKSVFALTHFDVMDTVVLRGRDGSASGIDGVLQSRGPDDPKASYRFHYMAAKVTSDERGRAVRLDGLHLDVQMPVLTRTPDGTTKTIDYRRSEINTDIEAREGQMVVVGKTTVDGTKDSMILVVNAAIVP